MTSSCGSKCFDQKARKRRQTVSNHPKVIQEGWTLYISEDTEHGTGDHENYFKRREVYKMIQWNDGKKELVQYSNCLKKAMHLRTKNGHIPWYSIDYIEFIFSRNSEYFSNALSDLKYPNPLNPNFG